ncbi:MAG: hypothetical protein QG584_1833 [Pseudomonadota bacterium]|nr:hypothetical protein [Pseudomonadota bacterium]
MTDPVLQAALEAPVPHLFGAIQIDFPDYTLRLLDGSGELVIGGQTFVGADALFGVLDSIGTHEETIGDEAPELTIGLLPPDAASAADLASGLMQGCTVTLMLGAFDPTSNTVIGTPEVVFYGEIDVPTYETSEASRSVAYTVVAVFERLFEVREGERASDGFHQSIWPGELGLEFMTGTVKNIYWGAKRQVGAQIGRNIDPAREWFEGAP